MSTAKLGEKHICRECGTRFFDMKKNPAVCPKCETVVEVIPVKKSRAKAVEAVPAPKVEAKPIKSSDDDSELDELDIELDDDLDEDIEDDDDDDLIEDTDGLDDDDIPEVVVDLDDDKE